MSEAERTGAGRYAYAGLDRVLHERARLGIVTSLAAHPRGLAFNDLKLLCDLSDGNLSRHLTVLQDADMVVIRKSVVRGRSQTLSQLTPEGRLRFVNYLSELEQVVADAAAARRAVARLAPEGSS
ncbi:MAG: transcriptional regulator [Terriglobales bacterium]